MSPFSLLYKWVTQLRNHLYDIEHKNVFRFETKVISVGNLSVGGTGKTPMVEYIIRFLLKKGLKNKVATLSRGYGRKTRGFLLAGEEDTASSLGDEPFQLYEKFKPVVTVAVGEERVLAIPSIIYERPENEVIILDDAFQHRSVKPDLSIVLSDYHRPFYEDYVLPAGRLRESRSGVSRADILIITKCPTDLPLEKKNEITEAARKYLKEKPVFFTGIDYGDCSSPFLERPVKKKIAVLSGIANPQPFIEHLEKGFTVTRHFDYPDHHFYSASELKEIAAFAQENQVDILTTEKDWVKLSMHEEFNTSLVDYCFYLPMMVQFLEGEKSFQQMIEDSLKDH